MSGLIPVSSNSRQCGQVIDPYSISVTLALGLPIMNPPAGVGVTIVLQSPFLGGLTLTVFVPVPVAALPWLELQPAIATTAAAQARKTVGFMISFAPFDRWYVGIILV